METSPTKQYIYSKERWVWRRAKQVSAEMADSVDTTSPCEPPVTKTMLSELDVARITHSPKLRHDINFDPELHFRPNLDGKKGLFLGRSPFLPPTPSLTELNRLESLMLKEVLNESHKDRCRQDYSANSLFWVKLQKVLQYLAEWRNLYGQTTASARLFRTLDSMKEIMSTYVSKMLSDMKEILETLIPHRSKIINESLDIKPLTLQIIWETEGFERFVFWLRDILKQHCAPMRDEIINEICIMLSEGARERDSHILVAGFKSLFSLFWAMESDVSMYNLLTSRITSLSGLASPVSIPPSSHSKRVAVSKSHPSRKSAQVSKWTISGKAMGKAITALPDSGADACYISPETAMSLGLCPKPGTKRPVKLANGRVIVSPGAVDVPWNFLHEEHTFHLTCWILPGCSHPIILGSKFLEETKCLTTLRHRIRRRYVPVSKSVCVNLIGEGKQRLNGFLNDDFVAALPDTGSDVMVISLDYARRRGLKIDTSPEDIVEVEFADGATALTEGVVRNAVWSSGGHSIQCDFLVLDDLSVDVILSKDYLFDMDVFSTCQVYLTEDDDLEHLDVYGIRLVRVFSETFGGTLDQLEDDSIEDVISQDAFSPAMTNREWARRDRIRDEIEALDGNKRAEAEAAEISRQKQWERARVEHRQRWTQIQTPNQLPASTIGRHGRPQLTPQRESQAANNSGVNVPPDQLARLDNASRRLRWPKRVLVSIPLLPLRRNSSSHPP